ncbi:unnamed protein product [Orchesella dallaii]|uniref:Cuticle protein 6 n=1 Tax=Orchesella dallaii TaxID=48710 RepID=A0ABP1QLG6_9HEXA
MQAFIVFAATLAVASAGLIQAPIGVGYAVAGAQSQQYHAQDELGQYSYGYSGGPSAKAETKTADGVVRGGYNYVDGNGLVQSVNYVADPINGFRVAATNLPVGPAPQQVAYAAAPVVQQVRAIAPVQHIQQVAAVRSVGLVGLPTYTAAAAPLNNGAVHVANLPLPPADTPEVAIAKANHFQAVLEAQLRG